MSALIYWATFSNGYTMTIDSRKPYTYAWAVFVDGQRVRSGWSALYDNAVETAQASVKRETSEAELEALTKPLRLGKPRQKHPMHKRLKAAPQAASSTQFSRWQEKKLAAAGGIESLRFRIAGMKARVHYEVVPAKIGTEI
ncbi:hypothetical protein [Microvirga sp. CF3016]|uniref:hypothetical protein n=1 Tax=Microvirga sp. CF3016 TaxID=3110181 RepID=UPI002E7816B0|nr:hypothetical protein [Microvirga sp. CF3016]MEE1611122.1 hypothetical protein [Microvirga sp. CF3016]